MPGRVDAVNTSRGGVPKQPVLEAAISPDGIGGDVQKDLRHHGGPERAVTLFSLDVIRALQAEGHHVKAGSTGENLTISGIDWSAVVPGRRLAIGAEVELQVTRYTTPCAKLSRQFKGGDFLRMSQASHPGSSRVCARVVKGGLVRAGDPVALL